MTVFNVEDSALKIGIEVWLACENGNFSCQVIESIMISKSKSWIKFKGCHKREDVEEFIGLEFSIPRSKFAPLNENDFYLVDLIGATVLDENRKIVGSVIDILSLPAQNVVVVESKQGEVLIPYVDAHIMLFDVKEKNLIVKDVEGLLN